MGNELIQDKISLLQLAFKGLEEQELQEMAVLTRFSTYPPGYVLCHEGEYEQSLYIVAQGSVVISKRMPEEKTQRVLPRLNSAVATVAVETDFSLLRVVSLSLDM